jgi:hypothetical protein
VKLPRPVPFAALIAGCELEILRGQEQVEALLDTAHAAGPS